MSPKAVVFYCNWSNYPGLKLSESCLEKKDTEKRLLVSMCSGRISPELILEAFSRGIWGVLITACPKDQCEHDGNYKTCGRITLLKTMIQQMDIDSKRLKMEWVDKGEVQKFQESVDLFMKDIETLGPIQLQ
jgi:coenzyme F420-reducing hydrogenase delta subunit